MIKLYTKNDCPHCIQAKKKLTEINLPFLEIDIEMTPGTREFLKEEGHRTVPQIYINGKAVHGGNNGLQKMTEQEIKDYG